MNRMARYVVSWGVVFLIGIVGCTESVNEIANDDETPPRVVATDPPDGGVWNPAEPIRIVFDEPVDGASVRAGVKMIGVALDVVYDPTTTTVSATATSPVESGAAYTLVIRDVRDLAGNAMTQVVTVNLTAE